MGSGVSCSKTIKTGFTVGKKYDFKNDSVSEVTVNKSDIVLLAKYKGNFYACGARCPHYGGPLSEGPFSNGKIRCPWHGACFDVRTGDIEDFPGLDCLPTYKVSEEKNGDIVIFCEPDLISKRVKTMTRLKNNRKSIIIIGGGVAACVAAQTLRQNKYDGKITIVSKDKHLPYDRTAVSKVLGVGINDVRLRDIDFYRSGDMEILNSTECTAVDFARQKVFVKNSQRPLHYNKLLIATGSKPKQLEMPGANLKNIRSLYTIEDSYNISQQVYNKDVVIIGGTFVGLELAWALRELCSRVTIISAADVPLGNLLGRTIGSYIKYQADKNFPNFRFYGPEEISSFEGNADGEVCQVITNQRELNADYIILAMWSVANADFCETLSTPIKLRDEENAIEVNQYMETNVKNVYAAGDVASAPLDVAQGVPTRFPYWNVASHHGKTAALNMLGINSSVSSCIPFYWINLFEMRLRLCGCIKCCDEVIVFVDTNINFGVAEVCFCALYRKQGIIKGVVAVGCDPIASQIANDLTSKNPALLVGYPPYIRERFPNSKPLIEPI